MGSHTDPRGTGPECSKPPRSPAEWAVQSASDVLTFGVDFDWVRRLVSWPGLRWRNRGRRVVGQARVTVPQSKVESSGVNSR